MLGQIAIHGLVAGQRQADAGGDEPVRFLRGVFADDRERDLPGLDVLQSFAAGNRSEEHTSELQSRLHLVCRLLLEKKKTSTNLSFAPRPISHSCSSGSVGKRPPVPGTSAPTGRLCASCSLTTGRSLSPPRVHRARL